MVKAPPDGYAIMETDEIKARLSAVGAEVETPTSEEFGRIVRTEPARWAKVVKASGAKAN